MQYDKDWLIGYLSEVIALEAELHSVITLIDYLESLRAPLTKLPGQLVLPDKPDFPPKRPDPTAPIINSSPVTAKSIFGESLALFAEMLDGGKVVIVIVVAALAGLFCAINWSKTSLGEIAGLIVLANLIGFAGIYTICLVRSVAIGGISRQKIKEKYEKEYVAACAEYKVKKQENQSEYMRSCREIIAAYEKLCQTLTKKYEDERINNQVAGQINREIDAAVNHLNGRRENISELLTSFYELDVVYSKYRNWIAVCSFAEYLESGRCGELGGADGAYNIYENELRLDRITDKLDIIIRKLDQIAAAQYKLYKELVRVNENITDLKASISEGFQAMKEQAETNARHILELADGVAEISIDVEKGFLQIDDYLAKLDRVGDKALAYLSAQRR